MLGLAQVADKDRDLLAERDGLMGEILNEPDVKARQVKKDRVDAIQKQLKQAPIYGTAPKGRKK